MGTLLTKLLIAAKAAVGKLLVKILIAAKAAGAKLMAKLAFLIGLFEVVGADDVMRGMAMLLIRAFSDSEEAEAAGRVMVESISQSLRGYSIAIVVTASLGAACLLITCIPLIKRALFKRHPHVFLSFQHLREPLAVSVGNALGQAGFRISRLPYQKKQPIST